MPSSGPYLQTGNEHAGLDALAARHPRADISTMHSPELIRVARGERPADLLLRNGRVVNVFSGEIETVDVAVFAGRCAGLGPGYDAREVVDLDGHVLVPGLIDAHVHIESSMVVPREFARAVLPRGTTTVITDPHEIANVHGLAGIRYMLDASEGLPLDVFVMASSCVPATSMGTAGAELDASALDSLRSHPRVLGLAEVMNYPGAIHGDEAVDAKLRLFADEVIDGHAPGVRGHALNAYRAAGPTSDHESVAPDEALEKLRRGLYVFLREATNARNLRTLLPALSPTNMRRVALCTDDRQPPDLLDEGGIDAMIRVCVEHGVDPVDAIRLATLNPAEHFRLRDRGAVAPGMRADFLTVEDLADFRPDRVFVLGKLVAENGRCTIPVEGARVAPPAPVMRVHIAALDFTIPDEGSDARVIRALPGQLVTEEVTLRPTVREGRVIADAGRDLLKIAVIERHTGSGRTGLGLVTGIGLREGAIASSVAHDHHNVIVVGADDRAMHIAAEAVIDLRGGMAVASGSGLIATLALPVGGLMADRPIEEVRDELVTLLDASRALGTKLHDPFMAISFLGLEVIPKLKLTDLGLIDVEAFRPVSLWV